MSTLKKLSPAGIQRALEKAERYRLLNEPTDAESICLDILEIEPTHQRALIALLLTRTDQFRSYQGASLADAREVLPRITSEYERAYYAGIICERWGKALYHRGAPGAGEMTYPWLREAMECYEKAERLRPAGNEDALLRWNACARLLAGDPKIRPPAVETVPTMLE
jgi:hypothetical protein